VEKLWELGDMTNVWCNYLIKAD
ncbi:MAG: hypothetical protein UY33_C0034G0008, partial [Candidatus Amesbacteria bacterium GW2011_GWA1_48_9]